MSADGLRLRRAEPDDADFLLELATHEDVEPYLSVTRPRDREGVLEEIERSQREPGEFGRFVVEIADGGEWKRAGFVREGARRKAYWRHGEWADGVLYGLVREDIE